MMVDGLFQKRLYPREWRVDSVRRLLAILICFSTSSAKAVEDDAVIVPEPIQLDRPVEFQKDIYPIFAGNCLACHNKVNAESDFVLESAESTVRGGDSGEAIVPGKPEESLLYQLVSRREEPMMPPMPNDVEANILNPTQLGLLRQWILEGAHDKGVASAAGIVWQPLNDQLNAVYAIAVGPFGRFVAAGRANRVTVYDLKAAGTARSLSDTLLDTPEITHRDYVQAIAFHPTGGLIATAGYRVVKLWSRRSTVVSSTTSVDQNEVTAESAESSEDHRVVLKIEPEPLRETIASADGLLQIRIDDHGKAGLWHVTEDRLMTELNRDVIREQQLWHLAADKAVREARVSVVKAEVAEEQKRLEEQNTAQKSAEEKHSRAVEAVPEAEKKRTEADAAVSEPEKHLAADPENEELKKKFEEVTKAAVDAAKAVVDAKKEVESAARGIAIARQSVARATDRLHARKDLQQVTEQELQRATSRHDESAQATAPPIQVTTAMFVPETKLAVTVESSGIIRLWETADGAPLDMLSFQQPLDGCVCAAASDGRHLVIETDSGTRLTADLFPDWKLVGRIGPTTNEGESVFVDRVLALAFSPDGMRLAAGAGEASRSGQLTIWKTDDWTLEREIDDAHSDTVYGLDFSADGKLLASGSADKFVKVFDVVSGEHVRSCEGHTHHVMDVSWRADRTSLASAGADNVIKVWNAETGEQRRTISTYGKHVTSIAYVGMEDSFLSSSGDKRVFFHRAGDGATIREFPGSLDYVHCSAVSGDGKLVIAGGEDGVVRVWNGSDATAITTFVSE